jgi:hypothetical protein
MRHLLAYAYVRICQSHSPKDTPSSRGLLQATTRDAAGWLAAARETANPQHKRLLLKYSMSMLVAAPLRDAPTARTPKPALAPASPLKEALLELLILDSPAVSVAVATVARAYATQFGAVALEQAVGDALRGFVAGALPSSHQQQHQQHSVTRMLDLALVLLSQEEWVAGARAPNPRSHCFAVRSSSTPINGPMLDAVLRVACTSNDAAHQKRVCRVLGVAFQRRDCGAAERLLDLLTLERDSVRVFAAMALFDGVLQRLEAGDDDDAAAVVDPLSVYPHQPAAILKFVMQFRGIDDSMAHVCAVAAMRIVSRVGARARAGADVECEALICVVAEYLVSLRHARKTVKKEEREARAATIESWQRGLQDAPETRYLVADAIAYYVVNKHETGAKDRAADKKAQPDKENAGARARVAQLRLDVHECEVARALAQCVAPIAQKPIVECILGHTDVAAADCGAVGKWLHATLFGSKKRKAPLGAQQE